MLLYDWQKIYKASDGSVGEIFCIFEMLVNKSVPTHRSDKLYRYSQQDFNGLSFLAHPDVLLYNSYKHSYKEIAAYLATASFRSISDYAATQTTTLELLHLPFADFLVANINDNSLLRIDEETNLVHFLYEEVPEEKH
jgi:hypothetical protein